MYTVYSQIAVLQDSLSAKSYTTIFYGNGREKEKKFQGGLKVLHVPEVWLYQQCYFIMMQTSRSCQIVTFLQNRSNSHCLTFTEMSTKILMNLLVCSFSTEPSQLCARFLQSPLTIIFYCAGKAIP